MTSASLMHEAGHSKVVHWDNPEGWDGEGGGRGFGTRGHMCAVADSCECMQNPPQHGKVISLQSKQIY